MAQLFVFTIDEAALRRSSRAGRARVKGITAGGAL
jgi:hypothetical protein